MAGSIGCSTPRASLQHLDPKILFKEVCESSLPSRVEGDLGLSYRGPEGSVSLNATGVADTQGVRVAVVNPVGETEASLKVEGHRLVITRQGRPEEWRGNWRGIPVGFVHRLMLGGPPCPDPAARKAVRLGIMDDELRVAVGQVEEYRYSFVSQADRRVLREVFWETQVPSARQVAVTVWGPDWKAVGREHELEIRWRRRSVDTAR